MSFDFHKYQKMLTLSKKYHDPIKYSSLFEEDREALFKIDNWLEEHRSQFEEIDIARKTRADEPMPGKTKPEEKETPAEIEVEKGKTYMQEAETPPYFDDLRLDGVITPTEERKPKIHERVAGWLKDIFGKTETKEPEEAEDIEDTKKIMERAEAKRAMAEGIVDEGKLQLLDRYKDAVDPKVYERQIDKYLGEAGVQAELDGMTIEAPVMNQEEKDLFDFKQNFIISMDESSRDKHIPDGIPAGQLEEQDEIYDWEAVYDRSGMKKFHNTYRRMNEIVDEVGILTAKEDINDNEIARHDELVSEYEELERQAEQIQKEVEDINLDALLSEHMTPHHPNYIVKVLGLSDQLYSDDEAEREYARDRIKQEQKMLIEKRGEEGKSVAKAIGNVYRHHTIKAGNAIANMVMGRGGFGYDWLNNEKRILQREIERRDAEGLGAVMQRRKLNAYEDMQTMMADFIDKGTLPSDFEERMMRYGKIIGKDMAQAFINDLEPIVALGDAMYHDDKAAKWTNMGLSIGKGLTELVMLGHFGKAAGILQPKKYFSTTAQLFTGLSALRGVPEVINEDKTIGELVVEMAGSYSLGQFFNWINHGKYPAKSYEQYRKMARGIAEQISKAKHPLVSERFAIPVTEITRAGAIAGAAGAIRAGEALAKREEVVPEDIITSSAIMLGYQLIGLPGRVKNLQRTKTYIEDLRRGRLAEKRLTPTEKLTKDIKAFFGEDRTYEISGRDIIRIWRDPKMSSADAHELQQLWRDLNISSYERRLLQNPNNKLEIKITGERLTRLSDKPYWSKIKRLLKIPSEELEFIKRGVSTYLREPVSYTSQYQKQITDFAGETSRLLEESAKDVNLPIPVPGRTHVKTPYAQRVVRRLASAAKKFDENKEVGDLRQVMAHWDLNSERVLAGIDDPVERFAVESYANWVGNKLEQFELMREIGSDLEATLSEMGLEDAVKLPKNVKDIIELPEEKPAVPDETLIKRDMIKYGELDDRHKALIDKIDKGEVFGVRISDRDFRVEKEGDEYLIREYKDGKLKSEEVRSDMDELATGIFGLANIDAWKPELRQVPDTDVMKEPSEEEADEEIGRLKKPEKRVVETEIPEERRYVDLIEDKEAELVDKDDLMRNILAEIDDSGELPADYYVSGQFDDGLPFWIEPMTKPDDFMTEWGMDIEEALSKAAFTELRTPEYNIITGDVRLASDYGWDRPELRQETAIPSVKEPPDEKKVKPQELSAGDLDSSMIDPSKAREIGIWFVDGKPVERNTHIKKDEILLSDQIRKLKFADNVNVPASFGVIDVDKLEPSHRSGVINRKHFIPEAQRKKRERFASAPMSIDMTAQKFDPEEVTHMSMFPYMGPPTVNTRGEVIQGNFRADLIKTIYSRYPEIGNKYRQHLLSNAKKYGINKDEMAKIERPVLVNYLDHEHADDDTAIVLGQYTFDDIETGVEKTLDPRAVVAKLGDRFDEFVTKLLGQGEGSVRALISDNGLKVLEWLRSREIITPSEHESSVSPKSGMLTREAKDKLEKTVTYLLFQDARADMDMLFEDYIPYNIQNILIKKSPVIADKQLMERKYETGINDSLLPVVQSAISGYVEFKKSGVDKVESWADQLDAFEGITPLDKYGGKAMYLIDKFNKSTTRFSYKIDDPISGRTVTRSIGCTAMLSDMIDNYTNAVKGDMDSMFPVEPTDRETAWEEMLQHDRDSNSLIVDGKRDRLKDEYKGEKPIDTDENLPNEEYEEKQRTIDENLAEMGDNDYSRKPFGISDKTRTDEVDADKDESLDDFLDEGRKVDIDGVRFRKDNIDELDKLFKKKPRTPRRDIEKMAAGIFEDHVYEQALPFLKKAAADTIHSGKDLRDFIKLMRKRYGNTIDPYLYQFARDLQSGEVSLNISTKEDIYVPSTNKDLERNRRDRETTDELGRADIPDGRGKFDPRDGQTIQEDERKVPDPGSGQLPTGYSTPLGKPVDQPLYSEDGAIRSEAGTPRSREYRRGDHADDDGTPSYGGATEYAERTSKETLSAELIESQQQALKTKIELGDGRNIRDTLPVLTHEQVVDVMLAERRYYDTEYRGKGFSLFNSTGSGKTFVGLGLVARQYHAGNQDILIVAPSQSVIDSWTDKSAIFGLPLKQLDGITDKGKGPVITTYANFRNNESLRKREFDFVAYDESHNILSGRRVDETKALQQSKYINNVTTAAIEKAEKFLNSEQKLEKIYNDRYSDPMKAEAAVEEIREKVLQKARELEDKTKVLLLSATPASYHRNLAMFDGLLFDIYESTGGKIKTGYEFAEGGTTRMKRFLMDFFNYRLSHGTLMEPEWGTNIGILERQFHDNMVDKGAASFRSLQVDKDYSRDFVNISTDIGADLDKGFKALSVNIDGDEELGNLARYLHQIKWFNYMRMSQLLEAMKAKYSTDRIQKHLDMGRKVVVFHTYNKALPEHPFHFDPLLEHDTVPEEVKGEIRLFDRKYPELRNLDLHDLANPITTLKNKFGDRAVVFNGTIPKSKRNEALSKFNTDGSGVDILIGQMEACREGIDLHDTTGKHQRLIIQMGLPIRPMVARQSEGRIYRIGVKSNSPIEYLVTGLNFERVMFADKISNRTQTVENLATGEHALNLYDSFKRGYLEANKFEPSPMQGTGGKIADGALDGMTEYEKAIHYYWQRVNKDIKRKDFEGNIYQPTPEPIGLKIYQFSDARTRNRILEPSAGDGSGIARFLGTTTKNTLLEPSYELFSLLGLTAEGKKLNVMFENHSRINKYNVILMAPPKGKDGAKSDEHVRKSLDHLHNGGRVVALVPEISKVEAFVNEREFLREDNFEENFRRGNDLDVDGEGKVLKGFYHRATVILPDFAVDKGGMPDKSKHKIVIIDKQTKQDLAPAEKPAIIDLSGAKNMRDLFDVISDIEVPQRTIDESETQIFDEIPGMSSEDLPRNSYPYLAELTKFIPREIYRELNDLAKRFGGKYYNERYGGKRGFVFKNIENRHKFYESAHSIMEKAASHSKHTQDIEAIKADKQRKLESAKKRAKRTRGIERQHNRDEQIIYENIINELEGKKYKPPEPDIEKARTKKGKSLVKSILKDKTGEKIGVRSIMSYFAQGLPIEVRARREQLTKKTPAHYNITGHFVRSQTLGSYIMSHEIGHAIWHYILNKDPKAFDAHKDVLLKIAEMEESMASAHNESEGFAEWMRRYMCNPESVESLYITGVIKRYIYKNHPRLYDLIQDVQMASAAHFSRSLPAQWRSFSKDLKASDGKNIVKYVGDAYNTLMFAMARGYGIELLDREIVNEIIRQAKAEGVNRKEAKKMAMDWRKDVDTETRLRGAYQDIVRLRAEIIETFEGQEGVKVIGKDGNYVKLYDYTHKQIVEKVGRERWDDFEAYVWAKVSLERWEKKKIQYPGYHSGVKPSDLEEIIKFYEDAHSDFDNLAKLYKGYHDALEDIRTISGEHSIKEGRAIKDSYEYYAHLGRVFAPVGAISSPGISTSHTDPRSGLAGLRGGGEYPYMSLSDASEKMVAGALTGYYWNKLQNNMVSIIDQTYNNENLPWGARTFADRQLSSLKMDTKKMADMSPSEQKVVVAKVVNDMALKVQIEEAKKYYDIDDTDQLKDMHPEVFELRDAISPEDIELVLGHKPIFRKVRPNAVHVIAPYHNGKRNYYQVNNPFTFQVFMNSHNPQGEWGNIYSIAKHVLRAWKATRTRAPAFAVRNMVYRNPWTGMVLGEGMWERINPLYYTWKGIFGKDPDKRISKIMGETFSKTLHGYDSLSEHKYWDQVHKEAKRAIDIFKYWDRSGPVARMFTIAGFLNELVLTPINTLWVMSGSAQFSLWGEERLRSGAALDAKLKGKTDSIVNANYSWVAGNFGEHSGYDFINHLYNLAPFVRPAVMVGYQTLLRATDPLNMGKNAFVLAWAAVIMPALLWVFNRLISTEEDIKRQKERPDIEKSNYMDIKGLRIPFYPGGFIGFGHSLTWNTMDAVVDGMSFADGNRFARNLAARFITVPGVPQFFMPQLRALIESKVNYSFFLDREIEPAWMSFLPAEERRYDMTPELYITLSRMTRMSPVKLEYMINQGISELYSQMLRMIELQKKGGMDKEYFMRNPSEIPFVGRLFTRNPGGWAARSTQKLLIDMDRLEREMRDTARRLKDKYGDDYRDTDEYKSLRTQAMQLAKLRATQNKLRDAQKYINKIMEKDKLTKDDWLTIEDIRRAMAREAADALTGVRLMGDE